MLTYEQPSDSTTTTLNDIPFGTVFYGSVRMNTTYYSAIWIKVRTDSGRHNVHAVSLSELKPQGRVVGAPGVATECAPVLNYRPLKNPKIVEG